VCVHHVRGCAGREKPADTDSVDPIQGHDVGRRLPDQPARRAWRARFRTACARAGAGIVTRAEASNARQQDNHPAVPAVQADQGAASTVTPRVMRHRQPADDNRSRHRRTCTHKIFRHLTSPRSRGEVTA